MTSDPTVPAQTASVAPTDPSPGLLPEPAAPRPATDADWAALTFGPAITDPQTAGRTLAERLKHASVWVGAALPWLTLDDRQLADAVAKAPDEFADLVDELARTRTYLSNLSQVADCTEIRIIAALTRVEMASEAAPRTDPEGGRPSS